MPQLRTRLPRVKLDLHSHILSAKDAAAVGARGSVPWVLPALPSAYGLIYPCQGFCSLNVIVIGTWADRLKQDLLRPPLLSSFGSVGVYLDVVALLVQLVDETLNMDKANLPQGWFIPLLLLLTAVSVNTFGDVAGNKLISFVAN